MFIVKISIRVLFKNSKDVIPPAAKITMKFLRINGFPSRCWFDLDLDVDLPILSGLFGSNIPPIISSTDDRHAGNEIYKTAMIMIGY